MNQNMITIDFVELASLVKNVVLSIEYSCSIILKLDLDVDLVYIHRHFLTDFDNNPSQAYHWVHHFDNNYTDGVSLVTHVGIQEMTDVDHNSSRSQCHTERMMYGNYHCYYYYCSVESRKCFGTKMYH